MEEVRITANNFSAVDGRNPGEQVQMLTRAGTNGYHGVGAYYFVNNTLAARRIFDPGKLPSIRKRIYGLLPWKPVLPRLWCSQDAFSSSPQAVGTVTPVWWSKSLVFG